MTLDLETILAFFQPAAVREVIASNAYSDVMINADGSVFADKDGQIVSIDGIRAGGVRLAVQNIGRAIGKDITPEQPILDARLPDDSRVGAVLNQDGSITVTIRKFNRWLTTSDLIEREALTADVREILVDGICGAEGDAANVLVSGGTSSGKSMQVNALIDHIRHDRRLIVIEKPRELKIKNHPNAVRWEAEDAPLTGTPNRSIAQLLVAALRHRPDHIIIGEVREPEAAYQMLQAMNTGHSGTLSTIHADSAKDALSRLGELALASQSNQSAEFVNKQVCRTIRYVVHCGRNQMGQRKVLELLKVGRDGNHERLFKAV